MCGISGGMGASAPTKPQLLDQLEKIKHRGPDSSGTYNNGDVSLGSCRLEVVEVTDGVQPFTTSDKKITVVFNGEIYNYKSLREQLSAYGLKFLGSSEAEVIAMSYLHFGLDFVNHLSGMFAIALFDNRDNKLVLARDRVGEKPLWYHKKQDGTLIFASEIKSLLPFLTDKSLRKAAIYEVMKYGYINSPNSAYSEIFTLPPARLLVFKDNKLSISKYWNIDFHDTLKISYKDAVDQTYDKIDRSVQSMLASERSTGLFLSGGYDSTLVAGFIVKNSPNQINTFSIGFENKNYSESHHARKIAEYLGTNHHEKILKPNPEIFLTEILAKLDQPFADSSYISTFELAKFANESVVVAFGGDGGDEICAGYDRYLAAVNFQRINYVSPLLKLPISAYAKYANFTEQKRLKLQSQFKRYKSIETLYDALVSLNLDIDLKKMLKKDFIGDNSGRFVDSPFVYSRDDDYLSKLLEIDFDNYLPGDLLVKADLASMSHGLELRSPLLRYELVEWMAKLPSSYKSQGFTTKRLLKDITHKFVPKEIMKRTKMGFAIPRAEWLRNELKDLSHDLLTDSSAKSTEWFDQVAINQILLDHQKGSDRDQLIWPALCLEIWARNWL